MMRTNPYSKGTDQHRAWARGYAACHLDWKETAMAVRAARPKWRSSVTGKFVAKLFGKANPKETVRER